MTSDHLLDRDNVKIYLQYLAQIKTIIIVICFLDVIYDSNYRAFHTFSLIGFPCPSPPHPFHIFHRSQMQIYLFNCIFWDGRTYLIWCLSGWLVVASSPPCAARSDWKPRHKMINCCNGARLIHSQGCQLRWVSFALDGLLLVLTAPSRTHHPPSSSPNVLVIAAPLIECMKYYRRRSHLLSTLSSQLRRMMMRVHNIVTHPSPSAASHSAKTNR